MGFMICASSRETQAVSQALPLAHYRKRLVSDSPSRASSRTGAARQVRDRQFNDQERPGTPPPSFSHGRRRGDHQFPGSLLSLLPAPHRDRSRGSAAEKRIVRASDGIVSGL